MVCAEDKVLINNLVLVKGFRSRQLLHQFPRKCWNKTVLMYCYVDDLK